MPSIRPAAVLCVFLCFTAGEVAAGNAGGLSPEQLLQKAIDATAWTRNVHMRLEYRIRSIGWVQEDFGLGPPVNLDEQSGTGEVFVSGQRLRSIRQNAPAGGFDGAHVDTLVTPDRRIFWVKGHSVAYTESKLLIEQAEVLDRASMLMGWFLDGNISDQIYGLFTFATALKLGKVQPNAPEENLGDIPCRVVDVVGDSWELRVWVAPTRDFNFARFTFDSKADPKIGRKEVHCDIKQIKYQQLQDGKWIIKAGTFQFTAPFKDRGERGYETTVTRTFVDLNPDFEKLKAFDVPAIPDGERVLLEETDESGKRKQSGVKHMWKDGKVVPAYDPKVIERIERQMRNDATTQPATIPGLSEELGVGRRRENLCSLLSIKLTMEKRGLIVTGYSGASVGEVWDNLTPGAAAVLYTRPWFAPAGHFWVVLGRRAGHVVIMDPGQKFQTVDRREFDEFFVPMFSGDWLKVDSPVLHAVSTVHRFADGKAAIKTTILGGQGEVGFPITFRNEASHPVRFKGAKGDCDCFRGIRPAGFQVQPGESVELEVLFDRAKFGVGKVRKQVVLTVEEGRTERAILLDLDVDVRDVQLEERVNWVPERLEAGLIPKDQVAARGEAVTIYLPKGVQISDVKTRSRKVTVRLESTTDVGKVVAQRYLVSILDAQSGRVDDAIEFNTTDPNFHSILIPFRAEIAAD